VKILKRDYYQALVVERIQLGNSVFEGANNVYLLDGPTTALLDTGVAIPDVRDELQSGLANQGVEFGDIDEVVLTHWHPDHAGLAGEIQEAGGADVFIHESDAPIVDGRSKPLMENPDLQHETLSNWGVPDDTREELMDFFASVGAKLSGPPAEVTEFTDGDILTIGGVTLEAVHLPGHTAGLTGFAFDLSEIHTDEPSTTPDTDDNFDTSDGTAEGLFSGDVILPEYTPNVGGADVRVDEPLAAYAQSLVRLVERDFAITYPGHRDQIEKTSLRAATILEHHRVRTKRVIDVLEDLGTATPWEVSAELFGSLSEIHILHGPGEAFAHLNHLASERVVERDGIHYQLVDADVDINSLFPTTSIDDKTR